MSWRLWVLSGLLGMVALAPQATSGPQHAPVVNIGMKQIISTQRVKIYWDKVTTAKRYRIKIKQANTLVARKTVRRKRAKFKETLFSDNVVYTVYVRAKPNAQYARTNWSVYSFSFFDVDHDNDFISDEEDFDDDNDGIPDELDANPYDVSGTVYTVKILHNALVNGTVSIAADDTITWVNQDEGGHAVAADNGSWSSPPLQTGESYSKIFADSGVFSYADPTYPGVNSLTGTITVLTP